MCKGPTHSSPLSPKSISKPSSGFERCKHSIGAGLLILFTVYGLVLWLNPNVSPAAKYCQDERECRRPDLIAYKVTSAMCMVYMGWMGVYNWHFSKPLQELSRSTPEKRLLGYLPAAENQNVAIFCYQVWDLVVSLTIPEHVEVVFLVHHVLAGVTAYFSLQHGMVPYYAVFFGGCSEFSSIFLVFADLDEFFPHPASSYEMFVLVCKALFTLSFTYFRVFGWWKVSWPLWKDTLFVLNKGIAKRVRPGKSYFLYVFLALNVVLGVLQLYWFIKIVEAVMEIASAS